MKSDYPPCDNDIRTDLISRVRWELQLGIYETPEKLETALARMLERIEEE